MFFHGSSLSPGRCERRVREAIAGDPHVVIADIHRLVGMQWFRDGNGRDVDVHVRFSGSYAHRYALTLVMLDQEGARTQTLWHREYGIRAQDKELALLIRAPAIEAAVAALGVASPQPDSVPTYWCPSGRRYSCWPH